MYKRVSFKDSYILHYLYKYKSLIISKYFFLNSLSYAYR